MAITHFFDIRNQPIRELEVTQVSVVLPGDSRPRAKVTLVNTDGLLRPASALPFPYPCIITPFEAIEIEDQGSRLHSMLAEESEGITFQENIAGAVADLVFVMSKFTDAWNENLPDPCFDASSHRMDTAIPAIKIANHADPLSIGSPDRETRTRMSIDFHQLRSELFVDLIVIAHRVQISVQLT